MTVWCLATTPPCRCSRESHSQCRVGGQRRGGWVTAWPRGWVGGWVGATCKAKGTGPGLAARLLKQSRAGDLLALGGPAGGMGRALYLTAGGVAAEGRRALCTGSLSPAATGPRLRPGCRRPGPNNPKAQALNPSCYPPPAPRLQAARPWRWLAPLAAASPPSCACCCASTTRRAAACASTARTSSRQESKRAGVWGCCRKDGLGKAPAGSGYGRIERI